jgi:hypothetical protein
LNFLNTEAADAAVFLPVHSRAPREGAGLQGEGEQVDPGAEDLDWGEAVTRSIIEGCCTTLGIPVPTERREQDDEAAAA